MSWKTRVVPAQYPGGGRHPRALGDHPPPSPGNHRLLGYLYGPGLAFLFIVGNLLITYLSSHGRVLEQIPTFFLASSSTASSSPWGSISAAGWRAPFITPPLSGPCWRGVCFRPALASPALPSPPSSTHRHLLLEHQPEGGEYPDHRLQPGLPLSGLHPVHPRFLEMLGGTSKPRMMPRTRPTSSVSWRRPRPNSSRWSPMSSAPPSPASRGSASFSKLPGKLTKEKKQEFYEIINNEGNGWGVYQ